MIWYEKWYMKYIFDRINVILKIINFLSNHWFSGGIVKEAFREVFDQYDVILSHLSQNDQ